MRIAYITNSSSISGVGHRAKNIQKAMSATNKRLVEFNIDGERGLLSKNGRLVSRARRWPGWLGNKSVNWIRLGWRLNGYIHRKENRGYDLYHATNQSLSWLVDRQRPMVVTVHDLIEITDPQDKKSYLLNKYLLSGIKKADHIIAVSEYTASQIKEQLGVRDDMISVIYNGAGPEFQQIGNFSDSVANIEIRKKLKISLNAKVVLFVGSDHPRKNVRGALDVFELIKKDCEDAVFLKVGEPGIPKEREKLLIKIDKMKFRDSVKFVSGVSDDELADIYNMSEVLIYPSYNEGFGLPIIQAMACGLPVVASNKTAVPEVVGDGGVILDVENKEGMARNCLEIIKNDAKRRELQSKGLKRAKEFSWEDAAAKVERVYERVVEKAKQTNNK